MEKIKNKIMKDRTGEIMNVKPDERMKSDYQRICEMAYRAATVEEAEVPLFYLHLMCRQLGYDNGDVSLRCGLPENTELPLLHEALWHGVAMALWASPCRIIAFRPREVYSFRGRLLKVEIRDVEHGRLADRYIQFGLAEILDTLRDTRRLTPE